MILSIKKYNTYWLSITFFILLSGCSGAFQTNSDLVEDGGTLLTSGSEKRFRWRDLLRERRRRPASEEVIEVGEEINNEDIDGSDSDADSAGNDGSNAGSDNGANSGSDSGSDAGSDDGSSAGSDSGSNAGSDNGSNAGSGSGSSGGTTNPPTVTPGNLAIPAPIHQVWDFDDQAVSNWNSVVQVSSASALNSALQTAISDAGTDVNPKYHDIVWTGGTINSDIVLDFSVSLPQKNSVFVRFRPQQAYTHMNGQFIIRNGITNVRFVEWQLQPETDPSANNWDYCFAFYNSGGSAGNERRLAFARNRFGLFWNHSSADPTLYPKAIGGSGVSGYELAIKDNEARMLFEFLESRAGYYHVENNFVTNLIDDFIFLTVRNASPNVSYLYSARNIVMDFADDARYNGYHPDYIQAGTNSDGTNDEYIVQDYANILIGDNYKQYPVMAHILQNMSGTLRGTQLDSRDNVLLTASVRGSFIIDRRTRIERNVYAYPPLGGEIPSSGTGWNGSPFLAKIWARYDDLPDGRNSIPTFGVYIAGQNAHDEVGWGSLVNPSIIADARATSGSTYYGSVFPNMAGKISHTGRHILIPKYTGPRTRTDVRNYISDMYMPAGGWANNGFNDPKDF